MANGILVCWFHHDYVHRRRIAIHRRGTRWVFTDTGGQELADPRFEADACHG